MQNYSNDPIATKLFDAARENNVVECRAHFGRAAADNIYINTRALLIAAEHKSYDAFEAMLDISNTEPSILRPQFSIAVGNDWHALRAIGQNDARIGAAIEKSDQIIDANVRKIFQKIEDTFREEDTEPVVTTTTPAPGILQRLKFW